MMTRNDRLDALKRLAEQRVVVLDGAMGTMIQSLGLDETDFRGERFKDHSRDLKGDNDPLNLTRPAANDRSHRDYPEAGADSLQTTTINDNTTSKQTNNLAHSREGKNGGKTQN